MARKIILDTYYSFTPSTSTIVFNQVIPRERFVLITNLRTNQVIFNFSDPSLTITAHSITTDPVTGVATTSITLLFNTAAMIATDKIQVVIDEYEDKFTPSEIYTDPVNKMRVSTGQSLIDTDFEYGPQTTKWETIGLLNNKPTVFQNLTQGFANSVGPQGPIVVTDMIAVTNTDTIVVLTPTPPVVNSFVTVADTNWGPSEGTFMVESSIPGVAFRYKARDRYLQNNLNANVSILINNTTAIANANVYSRVNVAMTNVNYTSATAANAYITTVQPHGLTIGNQIVIQGLNPAGGATGYVPNGTFMVTQVISNTVFRIEGNSVPLAAAAGQAALTLGNNVFGISRGTVLHRAYDGGVEFSTSAESHNNQLIRQTRRYFRYQSGKGIQVSTGTLLKPQFRVDSMTAVGNLITVKTKEPHLAQPNVTIVVTSTNQSQYNGNYTIHQVLDQYTFTYISASAPLVSPATGTYRVSANTWYGAANRVGLFDEQNGMFFEYDGQQLYAVRRSSTFQLAGFASANVGNTTITGITVNGVTTNFAGQLIPGDFIVLKGMSYRVEHIRNDRTMDVYPPYRGEYQVQQAVLTKTIETRIPQSQWNLDRCNGTGPSGFNLDLTKMQMFYLDYSWYGAGFVRWGFRGADGNIIYCHKMLNNNVNYEAHMRSGNLPARYETNTFSKKTKLGSTLGATDASMNVADASAFPPAGTVWVNGGGLSEYITYNGIINNAPTGYILQNLVRGQFGNTINVFMNTANATLNLVSGSFTVNIQPGMYVTTPTAGAIANIPLLAKIESINPNVSITLTQAPKIGGVGPVTFIPMGNLAQTFISTTTNAVGVELHAPGFSPRISHWGTSVIMDGRYDDDKSFVFTQGMTTSANIAANQSFALQSFRVAPTVSAGVANTAIGGREIRNVMQMVLRQLDILSGGAFLIQLVLNGTISNNTPQWFNVGGSSLAQYINHNFTPVTQTANGTSVAGGEVIYAAYTNASGGGSTFTTTQYELPLVRDLGSSVVGGGIADPTRSFYPDGPDIVTIVARNVGSTPANIFSRLSWTEAQA